MIWVYVLVAATPVIAGFVLGEILWKLYKRVDEWNQASWERWRQGNE